MGAQLSNETVLNYLERVQIRRRELAAFENTEICAKSTCSKYGHVEQPEWRFLAEICGSTQSLVEAYLGEIGVLEIFSFGMRPPRDVLSLDNRLHGIRDFDEHIHQDRLVTAAVKHDCINLLDALETPRRLKIRSPIILRAIEYGSVGVLDKFLPYALEHMHVYVACVTSIACGSPRAFKLFHAGTRWPIDTQYLFCSNIAVIRDIEPGLIEIMGYLVEIYPKYMMSMLMNAAANYDNDRMFLAVVKIGREKLSDEIFDGYMEKSMNVAVGCGHWRFPGILRYIRRPIRIFQNEIVHGLKNHPDTSGQLMKSLLELASANRVILVSGRSRSRVGWRKLKQLCLSTGFTECMVHCYESKLFELTFAEVAKSRNWLGDHVAMVKSHGAQFYEKITAAGMTVPPGFLHELLWDILNSYDLAMDSKFCSLDFDYDAAESYRSYIPILRLGHVNDASRVVVANVCKHLANGTLTGFRDDGILEIVHKMTCIQSPLRRLTAEEMSFPRCLRRVRGLVETVMEMAAI